MFHIGNLFKKHIQKSCILCSGLFWPPSPPPVCWLYTWWSPVSRCVRVQIAGQVRYLRILSVYPRTLATAFGRLASATLIFLLLLLTYTQLGYLVSSPPLRTLMLPLLCAWSIRFLSRCAVICQSADTKTILLTHTAHCIDSKTKSYTYSTLHRVKNKVLHIQHTAQSQKQSLTHTAHCTDSKTKSYTYSTLYRLKNKVLHIQHTAQTQKQSLAQAYDTAHRHQHKE